MNLPNKLTLTRVFMIPLFVIVMLIPSLFGAANKWVALIIFVVASITDFLDGYLARKNNLVTNFGKFMDPLADKVLVCSAMICLMTRNLIPAWVVIIIVAREFIISGFRLVASDAGVVIAASIWGKVKTNVQIFMIIFLLADLGGFMNVIGQILIYAAAFFTVLSLVDYMYKNMAVITKGGM